jgi:hypothetical protein
MRAIPPILPKKNNKSARIDVGMTRGHASFTDAENMDTNFQTINNSSKLKRKEMKGPQDIGEILSGLKTKNVKVETSSTISLEDLKDLNSTSLSVPKKTKRKSRNTVNLGL